MSRKIQFLSLLVLLGLLSTPNQSGFAQNATGLGQNPLTFENNFFVTGDYVVAGAQNMTTNFVSINGNSYANGTIMVPDGNPGINPSPLTGDNKVPAGAQIVAATLYWSTAEKVGATDGQTGQSGFFRPVFPGGPQTGYAISGASVNKQGTVSFSSGGCAGTSTGKVLRTYRADVRGAFPQDANGNVLANGTYEVLLPSTSSTTPITLGATLVIIYRVLSPNVPLNSIVIYDGDYAPGNNTQLTMTQTMQGFYQAAQNPVSRLTHIVGQGKSKKMQSVYLNDLTSPLSSLYPGQPPFPGFYGSWDNPTWTFSNPQTNPVHAGDASATTEVSPSSGQAGCVSWGAVIVSTTVQNTDGDGLLDIHKQPKAPNNPLRPGYCDAGVNEGVCAQGDVNWVDLPGAVLGSPQAPHPDLFVQADYLCSTSDGSTCDGRYSFNPFLKADPTDIDPATGLPRTAVQKVIDSFGGISGNTRHQKINLHVIPGNAIPELTCSDNLATNPRGLCAFPNQPGVVSWPGGLIYTKNQPLNYLDEASCEAAANGPCTRRFQHGKDSSYHYALFAHAVGVPNWTLLGGTLANADTSVQAPNVMQSGGKVTFRTTTPHLLASNANDSHCPQGRVTVAFVITDPSLNGTYCATVTGPNTFTIPATSSKNFTYTSSTDPNFAVMSGQADKVSGFSDIGGQNSLIGLGSWAAAFQTWQAYAGTIMHELGHSIGLTHGGFFFDSLTVDNKGNSINNDYTPTLEANCKANHQSIMNYEFQTKLLHKFLRFDQNGNPITVQVPDFSGQALDTLSEGAPKSPAFSAPPAYYYTRWYEFTSVAGGSPASLHCDGSAILGTDVNKSMIEHRGVATALSWSVQNGQDINFDGAFETTGVGAPPASFGLRGHNDWSGTPKIPGVNLRQIGATGSMSTANGAGQLGLSGGGGQLGLSGGGGQLGLSGGGGQLGLSGGGGQLGLSGGGGQLGLSGGGGQVGLSGGGGVGELTQTIEESVTDPPSNLVATEDVSPRVIRLFWTPASGEIGSYNIYRQPPFTNGNPMNVPIGQLIFHADTNQFEFDDTVTCNPAGYTYQVSAVQSAASTNPLAESERIGPVSTGQNGELLTGCYMPPVFLSPAAGSSPLQGSVVTTTWTLQDKTNKSGAFANNPASNSLVAVGPISNDVVCAPGSVLGGTPVSKIAPKGSGITFANNQFTFSWNTAQGFVGWPAMNLPPGPFPPGCYLLEDDLDSGQPAIGGQPASAFQVQIYLSDVNESVQVTTTSLPDAIVGIPYNQTLQESGGAGSVIWTIGSGSLPPNLALNSASGTLSGTPTAPGIYTFTVKVTDSIGDFGTQTLTLRVNAVVTNTLDSGAGSLRQAILDVNFAPSGSQPVGIIFKIPGGGVQTITPLSALPALTQPTILDATTQPGYAGTPIIELDGGSAGASVNGLHITAGISTVLGLDIHSFTAGGILIDTNGGDVIQANYVGTNVTGTTALPNGGNGIQIIDTPSNVIGGTTSSARNVISGNGGEGVRIDGALATGNVVQGNYIGTNVSGSAAVGNNASGVYIRRAPGNSIIGNTVSGNVGFAGITICGSITFCGGGDNFGPGTPGNSASGNIVQGNFVGTNSAGTTALGNNQAGVSIDGAPNTLVGRPSAGTPNVISFNGTNDVQIFDPGAAGNKIVGNTIQGSTTANTVGISVGVLAATGTGNTLSQNFILGHAGLGIDLAPAGVNQNQAGGANNFPVLTSAQFSGGTTTIMGTLNGTANAKYTIEFFSNQACNASGNGEGAVFLGSISVQTDGSGNAGFVFMVAGPAVGNAITSTSTDAFGTTSEFSACVTVM
jgi:hypothetical protein